MEQTIIIKNGAEYVCLRDDAGNCSSACPNFITPEGFLIKEAMILSRPMTDCICALQEEK